MNPELQFKVNCLSQEVGLEIEKKLTQLLDQENQSFERLQVLKDISVWLTKLLEEDIS